MIHIRYSFTFLAMMLSACSQSLSVVDNGARPDWLAGEPGNYPNAAYVSATGSASKPEVAKDRALGNLAKIFELQVRESSTTTQDVQTQRAGDVESVQATARIASKVNVRTDKIISGARIAEQWQNPDDLTHYALAVLDRRQAGNNILGEIGRLDREVAFSVANAESRADPLQQVADLQNAILMQAERDSLQKSLKIIDLKGRGKPSAWSIAELTEQQDSVLQSLNIRSAIGTGALGELDKVLQGAMANAGFAHSGTSDGYTLTASVETQDAMQKEGWYWLRGTLNINLSGPDGTVLGNKSWPVKVSALQQNQLNARMLAEIDNRLKSELKSTVLGFAAGGQ